MPAGRASIVTRPLKWHALRDDREATSNTGEGRLAVAGGVAGFPMPVLRYVVVADAAAAAGSAAGGFGRGPALLLPAPDATGAGAPEFVWADPAAAVLLRLEVQAEDGGRWAEVLSAIVRNGEGRYAAPPWFADAQRDKPLRWRVLALDAGGRVTSASDWRPLTLR